MLKFFLITLLFFLSFIPEIESQVTYKTICCDTVFNKKQQQYRSYHNNEFFILNPQQKPVLYSVSRLGGYKNTQDITEYFFSETLRSPIYKLSKDNLKLVFIENIKFIELLDVYCHSDAELLQEINGIYLLDALLKLSQTN